MIFTKKYVTVIKWHNTYTGNDGESGNWYNDAPPTEEEMKDMLYTSINFDKEWAVNIEIHTQEVTFVDIEKDDL